MMRKIEKKEMKDVSEMFADMFISYPLYQQFFKNNKNPLKKCVYYFFRIEIYQCRKFTYVATDKSCAAIIRSPKHKENSMLPLFINNRFFRHFFSTVGKHTAKLGLEYTSFAKKAHEGIIKEGDYYIKSIGVMENARGRGLLRKMIDELCNGNGIILETHDPKNIEIYQNLGFTLVKTLDFRGCNHYIMRRPSKEELQF